MYDNMQSSEFVSGDFHGEDQADLGRFFLPDIEPEEAAGWPAASSILAADMAAVFDWEDSLDEEAYEARFDPGVYEQSLSDSLDVQEALYGTYSGNYDDGTDY